MFGNLFKKDPPAATSQILVAHLNARLQPLDRGELFEDPLDDQLQNGKYGEVCGGGTAMADNGEIESCDIEIRTTDTSPAFARALVSTLEHLGAPKGSKLTIEATGETIPFGTEEGLAIYLNGSDLPDETYATCSPNFIHEEFTRLLGDEGRVLSYWEGPTETALYLYGPSFEEMKKRIADFVATYPLCAQCRIEQIA